MHALTRAGLLLIAGAFGSLAFAPVSFWPIMFLSVYLLVRLAGGPWRERSLQGLAYGAGFFLPLLHWSGTYVGAQPWIALALLQSLFFVPFAIVLAWIRTSPAAIAAAWVIMEALRSRLPWGGFGWGRVAFSQVDAPFVGIVALAGAPLLSFAVVFIASSVALGRLRIATLAIVMLGLGTLGSLNITSLNITSLNINGVSTVGAMRVAAVQGNVPRLGLDFNAQRQAVLDNHLSATARINPGDVDLVVWPENASDIDPLDDPAVKERVAAAVARVRVPVVVGAVMRDDRRLLNASLLWEPEKGVTATYVKRRLAPFGEFMPLRSLAERVVPEARRVVDFSPGSEVVLLPVGRAKIGAMICFEVLYDDLGRDLIRNGANLLIAQTNSATFGTSPESHQQLAMTRLRAIEHSRAIASVSTSGISAMIDHRGRVLTESAFFTQQVLVDRLELREGRTMADRIGGWGEAALASLPFMVFFLRRRV